MRLRADQLDNHLRQGLAPLYLVYGDEPLLVQETADAIRAAARQRDYGERECLTVDTGFDWNTLLQISATASLFAPRRLLELRLGEAKPGDAGSRVLQTYAQRPPADVILLITSGKLDSTTQKSRWFTALEAAGATIPLWPVDAGRLPGWIRQRMQARGLRPAPEAVTLLAEQVEGNLLAAAQEIDKLRLWFGHEPFTAEQLLAVVTGSARYSVYDLVDAALAGNIERVSRVLNGLRSEGVEPVLAAWALHREIRLLAMMAFEIRQGADQELALTRNKVWEKRKPLLRSALKRLPVEVCRRLLRECAALDRRIKGVETGDPWDQLLQLSVNLAGRELFAG